MSNGVDSDLGQSWPSCSMHDQLNELVKRSTCQLFYNFITKYFDIFCCKNERSFCTAKTSHFFSTKNIGVSQILTFEIVTKR